MSVDTAPSLRPRARGQLRRSARRRAENPLYRNGYALIASSGLTSALGLVYWLVAARNYSPYAVGIGSALIAAMTTIANLCHLNLKSALNRFLPRAGSAAGTIVVRSYAVALLVSGVVSVAFVAGTGIWAGHLAFLRHNPVIGLGFILATMGWTIFVLQDSALTGVRQAVWVPLENLVYSIAKLVLLVMLVTAAPRLGAFVAWSAVVPLVVVVVNVFLFRRLLPAHASATERRAERVTARAVVRYVASDYVAYLIMTATIGLLPLVVLAVRGPEANAHYFVAWSIAYGLYLIASGMGMSMISEAAHDPGGLSRYRREALRETAKIVVPCALVVALAAPHILQLLGHGYASAAGTLLRLLALSALPWIVFATYTNEARVERRMRSVVIATAALFGLVLAIGLPLLAPMGIEGLGVGWLAGQSIVAVGILGRDLATQLVSRAWEAAVPIAIRARQRYDRIAALGPPGAERLVLAELRRRPGWSRVVIQRRLATVNDVSVAIIGPRDGAPAAVLKRARTIHGDASLAAHARVLLGLKRAPELGRFRDLVPAAVASGLAREHGYLAESHLDGLPMEVMVEGGGGIGELLEQAATTIDHLHAATARSDRIDRALMHELVGEPVAAVRDAVLRHSQLPDAERGLELVRETLEAALADQPAPTAWVHGDYSPGNVLMAPDGRVIGIVDWELSRERSLPQLDLLQLTFSTRCAIERRELGPVVAGMLRSLRWRPHEGALERRLSEQREGSPPLRALVLLAWLQHAAANIGKSGRYTLSGLWVQRNVDPVLRSLLPVAGPAPAPAGGIAFAPRLRSRRARLRGLARSFTARRGVALPLAALGAATVLWGLSLPQIAPRRMSDLGLISVLPPTFVAALAVLTLSFASLIHRRPVRSWLLAAHVLALIVFIHATPTIVYGTLRYSWAFKHVGIVDYIVRHGSIDPAIHALPVYHNWPGFFALIALLLKSAGLSNAMSLATWGPVFNNILYLGALLFLFSGLTRSRRTVWLGCWLFVLCNWVGQDYFSPQGFAFGLYLLLLGIVVRWLGPRGEEGQQPRRSVALALAVLVLAAIAPSHALTSVMAAIALTALVVTRVCRVRSLPVIAGALTLVWDLVFAWDYTSGNLESTATQIHLPWATARSTLTKFGSLSPDQAHVATIARGLTAGVVVLAAAGVLAQLRSGRLSRAAVVLAAAPVLLFATGNYDGEILFRIFLFSVPFLAFLAAHALLAGPARLRPAITAVVATVLLGGFLVSYYGKERLNYFTPQEVAAARFVDTHAPAHSLLIDGTNNYPFAFKNYERFTYVSVALEPRSSWSQVLAHPVAVLSSWMRDPRYRSAYLILTRSQDIEVESYGDLPRGSLDRVRAALLASPTFRVAFRNRDATVFTLAGRSGAGGQSAVSSRPSGPA